MPHDRPGQVTRPRLAAADAKRSSRGTGFVQDAHGWWLAQVGPVEPEPELAGDEGADVVVIGGGFAGMWTAWLIREQNPGASVALLESGVCGEGPSGRNGGFVNSMWFSLPSMRPRFGDEGAIGVARAAQAAVDEVGAWCDREGVDARYLRGGYLQVSTAPAQDEVWAETVASCVELGEPGAVEALTPEQVAARCSSPIFRAGAFFPGSAMVDPARLSRGLRAALINAGVTVYERSRVLGINDGPSATVVRTKTGSVVAGQVVLAIGGAHAQIKRLGGRLTLTSSHMVITEPVPDVLEDLGWGGGECITDARHMIHYFRTTADGRIAFGWGGGRVVPGGRLDGRAERDPDLAAEVERHLRRFFPQLEGRAVDHAWGGPIDVSPSHTPIVGSLSDRVHYGFGFTGNGVGPSRMVAHALASLALDRRDEHTRLAIVEPEPLRVPPEPFRYIGGALVRAALLRKEAAEEEGRSPDPLTAFVAGVPELVGIQIGR